MSQTPSSQPRPCVVAASPGKTKIGWIGTGVMGHHMCGHLLRAGYEVSVTTRTAARADQLVEQGARWCETPRHVAENSDIIFSMVGFPSDVREVLLGEQGVIAGIRQSAVVVDLTTSEPSLAREVAQRFAEAGAHALDAPVSGGDVGAREARLSIMVGGDELAFEIVRPLLEVFGKTVVRQGSAGCGQDTKMVNQILIASGMVAVCEALLYGYRAGLDLEQVLRSVSSGAAASWSLSNYGPRMLAGNFEPGFFVEHFIKDMGIALQEAKRMNLALPGLALAHQLYLSVSAQGYARKGTHALMHALSSLSAIDWNARNS